MVFDFVVDESASTFAINIYHACIVIKASEVLLLKGNTSSESNSYIKRINVVAVVGVDAAWAKNLNLITVSDIFANGWIVLSNIKVGVSCEVERTQAGAINIVLHANLTSNAISEIRTKVDLHLIVIVNVISVGSLNRNAQIVHSDIGCVFR